MSRTNGDSKMDKTISVGGEIVFTEKNIEMTKEKSYKQTIWEKIFENPCMEKKAFDSVLKEDGKLYLQDGRVVAIYSSENLKALNKNRKERKKYKGRNNNSRMR